MSAHAQNTPGMPNPGSVENASPNPYLVDAFAPVDVETTAFDLPVSGRLPGHLDGRYLRNGPNPLGISDPATPHLWTLGEGMVHGVRLRAGRAEWYRNRWVRSGSVADRLGEPRRGTPADPLLDLAPNVHVVGVAGRTYALLEGGIRPYELTDELDTVGPADLGATADGFSANAHAAHDPVTGELHCLAFRYGVEAVRHIVLDAHGRTVRTRLVPVPGNPYMHDLGLTASHVLLFDTPLVFDAERLADGIPFGWDHARPTRIGLLPRQGDDPAVRWYEVPGPAATVGHAVNAHETPTGPVIDLIVHPDPVDLRDIARSRPVLERWSVDVRTGTVRRDRLDDRPQDFPRINGRHSGVLHRYAYTAAGDLYNRPAGPTGHERSTGTLQGALIKHDLLRGTTEVREFGPHAAVGEAVFVSAENPTAEDDGFLLTFVHDVRRRAADLVVLAAQDLTGPPVARVHLPVRVPLGLHGNWLPSQ
ncbi:carotenoid oxygenase family protein [Streptomyces sp. NBC_00272]|uniref:carotenoid oxygenase family protein n=1 Tax=Streptomyces sp. NBC_00272 TaxID=2975698 RepID=UPI002E2DB945|nr:carotenoid oxygenase family protein [Streptomyces sp. NBC_00272]